METAKIPKRPKSTVPLIGRVMNTAPVKGALSPLEKMTAGKQVPSDGTAIVKTDRLTESLLRDFFENRILGIHMPGFCKKDVCEVMAGNILKEHLENWNVYDLKKEFKASDVNTFGDPFNMANKNDDSWQRYFASAIPTSEKLRSMAAPYASPFDQFRIMIDEHWKHGLTVAKYKGRKMSPGLVRVMFDKDNKNKQGATSLGCHVDSPPIMSKKEGLFSVNIYLKQAESGGHLYIWNPQITTLRTLFGQWNLVKNFFLESNYMNEELQIRFQKFLPPPVMIEIGQGDVVMLNTGRPHAVVPFSGGPRVSLQAFLNYKKNHPIGIWA